MIIGLTGRPPAGSGKDTVADRLCDLHGFVRVALADPMKRFCQDIFDFSDEQLWGPSDKRNEPDPRYPRKGYSIPESTRDYSLLLNPRYALQQLGTEWGRSCYENVWVDYALRVYTKLQTGDFYYEPKTGLRYFPSNEWARGKKNVVITDVRFDNEAEAIRAAGGRLWCIDRPGAGLRGSYAAHASEKGIDEKLVDKYLQNSGSIKDLLELVDEMIKSEEGKMT